MDRHSLDEACAVCRETVAKRPDLPEAHANLGWVLLRQSKLHESIRASQEAIKLNPKLEWAHNNLGLALERQGKHEEAIMEYRVALKLDPGYSKALTNLILALVDGKAFDEAATACREIVAKRPQLAEAHANLGWVLLRQNKVDESIRANRDALKLNPKQAWVWTNLGIALERKGDLEEAIVQYRNAIAQDMDYAPAYGRLGRALEKKGLFVEALAALERCQTLDATDPRKAETSARNVAHCRRLMELELKLPEITSGKRRPASEAERLELAEVSFMKSLFAASARLYLEAFSAEPKQADGQRYNAARAAALAGCGHGHDKPPLDDADRAHWRKQALVWLQADLVRCAKLVQSAKPQDRSAARKEMQGWKQDPQLAGVREVDSLKKLSSEEAAAWRQLWADVDALLERTVEKKS